MMASRVFKSRYIRHSGQPCVIKLMQPSYRYALIILNRITTNTRELQSLWNKSKVMIHFEHVLLFTLTWSWDHRDKKTMVINEMNDIAPSCTWN